MKKILFIALCICFHLATMNAQQNANLSKLSPFLVSIVQDNNEKKVTDSQSDPYMICVMMTIHEGEDILQITDDYQARHEGQFGRVHIITLPVNNLAALSCDERVERVEANPPLTSDLDTMSIILDGEKVYAGEGLPQAFDGTGVIAGIVDTGLDFTHPAFFDKDGNTRVKYFYDIPAAVEYPTPADVVAVGASKAAKNSNEYHGTHVMGILAGSRNVGTDGKYSGIASGAEICAVDFTATLNNMEGTDSQTLLGFKKVFDWADKQGKPCVINLSASGNPLPRNPYTLETEVIKSMTGPGRIIVTAAGNHNTYSHYMRKSAGQAKAGCIGTFTHTTRYNYDLDLRTETPQTLYFCVPRTSGSTFYGEISVNTADIDAQGEVTVTSTINSRSYTLTAKRGTAMPESWGKYYEVRLQRSGLTFGGSSTMGVRVEGDGEAEIYFDKMRVDVKQSTQYADYNDYSRVQSITWPADRDCVIGVGALGYRYSYTNYNGTVNSVNDSANEFGVGKVALTSGRGPGLYDDIRPDVTAPGVCIRSAYNSFDNTSSNKNRLVDPFTYNGNTYYWLVTSGTSMATPAVAGAIALWLQAKPGLTIEEAREVIAHTSKHPDPTLEYPNNLYGHGEIDIYKGLLYILDITNKIDGFSDHQPQKARFDLHNKQLTISYDGDMTAQATVSIYTTDGRLVMTRTSTSGQTIDLSALGKGVYAVQLHTGKKETTGSTLIRL